MSYAVNAQLPVIRTGDSYYALDNGVWFVAASPTGPWEVAAEVPEEIYTIPPSSPVYYATFARVYQATEDEVEVGYTPGYQGAYEDEGTVVYGTGWDYEPWTGDDYYGWGWTWGYSYVYVPWYQWWVWRPWWNQPGGLRAAVIENIYDRWQGRNGVTHYDGAAPRAPPAPRAPSAPARTGGTTRAERAPRLHPPATRPCTAGSKVPAVRLPLSPPAEYARAQPLLPSQSSLSAGRDAARRPIAHHRPAGPGRRTRPLRVAGRQHLPAEETMAGIAARRAAAGAFVAPTQGPIERTDWPQRAERSLPARARVYRPTAGRDAAGRAQRRRVAAGCRTAASRRARTRSRRSNAQYYARSLAQMRAQNWRRLAQFRPARPRRRPPAMSAALQKRHADAPKP